MKIFFRTLACVAFTFAAASFLILNQVMATTNNQIGVVKGVSTVELAATTGDNNGTTSYTLTVAKTGSGTVTSNVTSINCGTACSASLNSGTSVQLIASAATGYTFSGWGSGCTVGESPTTCSVLMSENKTITAAFTENPGPSYTLTIIKAGTGKGTVYEGSSLEVGSVINCGTTCSASFLTGTSIILNAIPDSGSTFTTWQGCADPTGPTGCTIQMNGDVKITANFSANPSHTLTIVKAGTGSGTVYEGSTLEPGSIINCGSICSANILSGATITLNAVAADGSTFVNWAGCYNSTNPTGCSVQMNGDVQITAVFNAVKPMFKISEVSPFASSYAPGSNIEFKVRGIEPNGTWTTANEYFQASGTVYYVDTGDYPYPGPLYSTQTIYDPATGWWTTKVPAPSVPGDYRMWVVIWCGANTGKYCADTYGSHGPQVGTYVPFKVGGNTALPDLMVDDAVIQPSTPIKGKPFVGELKVQLANNGNATATHSEGVRVSVAYKKSDGSFYIYNGIDTLRYYASNISNGQKGLVLFPINNITFDDDVINLTVWVDNAEVSDGGFIKESNESNNKFTKTISLVGSGKPDLLISDVMITDTDFHVLSRNPLMNEDFLLQPSYKNIGGADAIAPIEVSFTTGDGISSSYTVLSNILVGYGGSTVNQYKFNFSKAGVYTVKFLIDAQSKVDESNEENNSYTKTITLGANTGGQVKTIKAPKDGYYAFRLISYDSAASTQFININNKISLSAPATKGDTQLQLTAPLKVNTSYIIFNSDTDGIDQLEVLETTACCITANSITLTKALTGNYPASGTYVVPLMGNYWGRFPTPEPAYNLGYFTAGQEIKVAHSSHLYSQVGPFVPGANPDYFYITQDGDKFTAYIDEGYKTGPLDAKWEVYRTDSAVITKYPITFPLVKANNSGTVHPTMSDLLGGITVTPTPTPVPVPKPTPILTPVTSAEVKLLERIQQLEYRVTELERSVVEAEKGLVQTVDPTLTNRVAGRILLQVENRGEAWYVDKDTSKKFYLKDGATAYAALQAFGLGITNDNLSQIPVATDTQANLVDTDGDGLDDKLEESLGTDINNPDSDGDGYSDGLEVGSGYSPLGPNKIAADTNLSNRLNGKILLQVEGRGQAWYVLNGKRHYLKDGPSAYEIMRLKSLGITNTDLRKIQVGDFE